MVGATYIEFGEIEILKIFDLEKNRIFLMSLLGVKIGPKLAIRSVVPLQPSMSLIFAHVAAKIVSETQSMLGFVLPTRIVSVVMLGTRLGGPEPRKQARAIF